MEPRDIEAMLARLDSIESLLRHVLVELQSRRPVEAAYLNQGTLFGRTWG